MEIAPTDQRAAAIAAGLQTGTVSGPSALSANIKSTAIANILPAGWRQPYPRESRLGGIIFGILTLACFVGINYPEIRKNFDYLPATCEPYNQGGLHPEIRPYRYCYQSCFGCFQSWTPVSCMSKMIRHRSINEYDLDAMWYIAGSCAGSSCCAQTVCQRCTKHETRCSRRLSLFDDEVLLPNNTSMPSMDEVDEAELEYDRHEVIEKEEELLLYQGHELSHDETSPWVTSLGRRLQSSNCRQVTKTYDCNCQCARRVYARACSIRCVPHWRSFVPIRVSVYEPAPGFYEDQSEQASQQALSEYRAVMSVNATSAAAKQEQLATVNRTDALKLVEMAEAYALPGFASATAPVVMQGFSRVLTVVYQHGASRNAALRNLKQPHFAPGVVSDCFYDPHVKPNAAMISRGQLYFSHEMGCKPR